MAIDDQSAPAFDRIRRESGINTADAIQLLWLLVHDERSRRARLVIHEANLNRVITPYVSGPSAGDLQINVPSGQILRFSIDDVIKANFSANGSTHIFSLTGVSGLTGADVGVMFRAAHSEGTNNVPGMFAAEESDGSQVDHLWPDDAGLWRTSNDPPQADGTPAVASGTVVGDQTSTRSAKTIEREWVDVNASLDRIRRTPVFEFTYKDGRYHGERFTGPTVEDSPDGWIGKDHGQSLNEISLFGHLLSAIKALTARVEALEARLSPHGHAI